MSETVKPGLLIFYDYFYPAYKAGGPVQSLTNLALSLQHEYTISVITGAHDLNDDRVLTNIKTNCWSEVTLPKSACVIKVWYAGSGEPGAATIRKILEQVQPTVIYLNGMFSFRFVLLPLIVIKKIKIVLCPRGMLQKGALAGKPFKKRLYLTALKISGLANKLTWHATNEAERSDIKREFGEISNVYVAGNIPKKPVAKIVLPSREPGELRLVYLSLISEKKNLLQLIKIISRLKENISLDIYGPVKDEDYWKKCVHAMNSSEGKVKYMGDVLPEKVQDIFAQYHASILLTRGENFGHALYESLSAGRPVITSYFTPWNRLESKNAGWNVDISNDREIEILLSRVSNLEQPAYDRFYNGAYALAKTYYSGGFDTRSYKALFSQ